jgi:hypothetical protein
MEKKNKDILKKGLMEPSSDFTSSIMNQIKKEDRAISNILSEKGSMTTSPDFTANLMSQLDGKKVPVVNPPLISKGVWIGIAAMVIGVITLTLFSSGSTSVDTSFSNQFDNVSKSLRAFFSGNFTLLYVIFGVLLLSVGLLLEQRLGNKKSFD